MTRRKSSTGISVTGIRLRKVPVFEPSYDASDHRRMPHVVKFSGGRSSAMMLFILLKNKILDSERGDVVIFNNTSAEHPATYEFAARCKRLTERRFGIPFFWVEYQTYETARGGEWTRMPTYRLVHSSPRNDGNPFGYHHQGEIFEELVSWLGYLPSRHRRSCTSHLKLRTTIAFLEDWFAAKAGIDRLGHHYESSQLTDDDLFRRHRSNRGMSDKESYLKKKHFVRKRPYFRPAQCFADFSEADCSRIDNIELARRTFGKVAELQGEDPVEYLSWIGLRGDEPNRAARVRHRNTLAPDAKERCIAGLPEGEYVYLPLEALCIDKNAVLKFWAAQNWDLQIPHDVDNSNCVYCFMKGSGGVRANHASRQATDGGLPEHLQSSPDAPSDIAWWVRVEETYTRVARRRGNGKSKEIRIGFFGADAKLTYRRLMETPLDASFCMAGELPCDCTD